MENSTIYQDKFYAKITETFLRLIIIALIAMAVITAVNTKDYNSTVAICIIILFLFFLGYIVSSDTYSLVFGMLLWSITILVTNFVWSYNGIFNIAMMALPGILTLAVMFNRNILFYSLLVYMQLLCISLGLAHSVDFIPFRELSVESAWPRVAFTMVMILILGISVRYFFRMIERYMGVLQIQLKRYKSLQEQYKGEIGFDKVMKIPTEYSCNQVFNDYVSELNSPLNILGCLLVDIKNIEQLKSSLGHKIIEHMIIQLGEKFGDLAAGSTSVFLFRGNEFVFLSLSKSIDDVERLANQISLCIAEGVAVDDHEIEINAAVGIALAPYNGNDLNTLLTAAHLACDKASNGASNGSMFFDEAMKAAADFNYLLISDMKKALVDGEFELHYQPKIHLESGDVRGAEALIRWNKARKGGIPPDVFIPLAEESGFIVEIGKWVLREACFQCKEWHRQGLTKMSVAVNVSPVQFRKGNFPYVVMQALHDADLEPEFLEIEITESALGDQFSTLRSQIQSIASKGVTVSIDDFGTGYSNLGHLSKFNISCLKIDRSFIKDSHTNPQDLHIIKAVLQMSKGLAMTNVAEGVEELEHMQLLTVLGCTYGQGYYWSKPLPNDQFVAYLKAF